MRRRDFISALGTGVLTYKLGSKVGDVFEFHHPPLVHSYDKKPARIIVSNSSVDINLPEVSGDSLLMTANEYGDPSSVYKKYNFALEDGRRRIEPPKTNKKIGFTLYLKHQGNLKYLGESLPTVLGVSGMEEDVRSVSLDTNEIYPFEREVSRGHYTIKSGRNGGVSYPVSQQNYSMGGRTIGYANLQEKALDSKLCGETGKRIINQSGSESEIDKLVVVSNFVQSMEWKSDVGTENVYHYVRNPSRTLANMYGDCKDRTLICNGMISRCMDLTTAILFSPGHMFTGVKKSDLSDSTIETIKNRVDWEFYKGMYGEYVPIGSTTLSHDVGEEIPDPVFAIYSDHFEIVDLSGLVEHYKEVAPMIANLDESPNR